MQFIKIVCLPSLLNGERGHRSFGGLGLYRSKSTFIGINLRSKGLDYYLVLYIYRRNLAYCVRTVVHNRTGHRACVGWSRTAAYGSLGPAGKLCFDYFTGSSRVRRSFAIFHTNTRTTCPLPEAVLVLISKQFAVLSLVFGSTFLPVCDSNDIPW